MISSQPRQKLEVVFPLKKTIFTCISEILDILPGLTPPRCSVSEQFGFEWEGKQMAPIRDKKLYVQF